MKNIIAVLAVLAVTGCNVTLPKIPDVKPPVTVTTTSTTTTTQPVAPMAGPDYTKDFDWADAEGDNSTYCGGVEVRCLVNDGMMAKDAWITYHTVESKALVPVANADGSVTLTGKDFETSRNSYHFEGWKIKTDQSKLITDATITLKGDQKGGTTRGYWRTVKRNKPAIVEPTKPTEVSSGNVPDLSPSEAAKYTTLPRNYGGRMAEQGEFHGAMQFKSAEEATNYRYGLRGYMEHILKIQTGYASKGQCNISAQGNVVTWAVMQ